MPITRYCLRNMATYVVSTIPDATLISFVAQGKPDWHGISAPNHVISENIGKIHARLPSRTAALATPSLRPAPPGACVCRILRHGAAWVNRRKPIGRALFSRSQGWQSVYSQFGRAKRGRRGALYLQILLAGLNSLPEGRCCGAWGRRKVLKAGSRATERFEPGQGREAAALRSLFRAPRGRLAGAGCLHSARSMLLDGRVRGCCSFEPNGGD